MITEKLLKSLKKGDKVTYLYISKTSGLPCCLQGFIVGSAKYIEKRARRFLLVKGNSKGKYIEEGEGYILKGWHDLILWETVNNEKIINVNVDLMELIKIQGLETVLLNQ